jgi:hypothetical protein
MRKKGGWGLYNEEEGGVKKSRKNQLAKCNIVNEYLAVDHILENPCFFHSGTTINTVSLLVQI